MSEYEQKFNQLYDSYEQELYHYIYMRCGMDTEEAQEILQDVFVKIYTSLDKFHGLCSERTWIYKIVKNTLADYYRKKYRCQLQVSDTEELLLLPDESQDIWKVLEKEDHVKVIKTCMQHLSQQYRILLIMKYLDERKTKEIAAILNKTPKAVERMLRRARDAFIKQYQIETKMENKEVRGDVR